MRTIVPTILLLCLGLLTGSSPWAGEVARSNSRLTSAEKAWLEAHPIIRLAPDPEFRPIEFFTEGGTYSGIGADYVQLIGKKLGIRFTVVHCKSWDEVIARTKRREIDILNAVVKTPEREAYLFFPPPYLRIPSAIIVRQSVAVELTLEKLRGLHVVMVSGYGYVDLIQRKYPYINIELVPDLKVALRKLSFGMADAFVGDLATASFYIESEGITNLKIAGESDPPNISGFAVRSDWPELAAILEKGVTLLTEEEKLSVYQRWIHLGQTPGMTLWEVQRWAMILIVPIFLVIIGVAFWNRQLNSRVALKTEDLRKEILERQQAEDALKESEEKFRTFADTSPLAIYMWEGPEQKAVYINPTFTRFFGYTIEDIPTVDQWWPVAYPDPVYRKQLIELWERRVIHASEATTEIEPFGVFVQCKDGSQKYIAWSYVPRGARNWACGLDLTERKKAEEEREALSEQLRQSEKMNAIGQLAGGIAHDFNNQLGGVLGYAELLLRRLEDPALKRYAQNICTTALRSSDLTQKLLSFSRKGQFQGIPFDVHKTIIDTIEMLMHSVDKRIRVIEHLEATAYHVSGDPSQFQNALLNLALNARDAMPDGGVLTLSTGNVSRSAAHPLTADSESTFCEHLVITVKDTGHGMTKEVQSHLFEPFFTTKKTGEGTGMGLASVFGTVKQHNGAIDVSSELGSGTTFSIFLPTLDKPDFHDAPLDKEPSQCQKAGTILVVEDEAILRELAVEILESAGHTVLTAVDGQSGLALYQEQWRTIDLVILDMIMPELDGHEAFLAMKAINPAIKAILSSGYSLNEKFQKIIKDGVLAFIQKPFKQKALLGMVATALDEPCDQHDLVRKA